MVLHAEQIFDKVYLDRAEIIEKRAACDREDTDCTLCFKESHCKALAKAYGKEYENA